VIVTCLACASLLIDTFISALCLGCGGDHSSVSVEKKRADFIASSQLMATSGRNCTPVNSQLTQETPDAGSVSCSCARPANSKSLTEKAKKAAKMAGFSRLFSPMSSKVFLLRLIGALAILVCYFGGCAVSKRRDAFDSWETTNGYFKVRVVAYKEGLYLPGLLGTFYVF